MLFAFAIFMDEHISASSARLIDNTSIKFSSIKYILQLDQSLQIEAYNILKPPDLELCLGGIICDAFVNLPQNDFKYGGVNAFLFNVVTNKRTQIKFKTVK